MSKKVLLGALAVFVVFMVMDFIVHGKLLESAYQETQSMWRPDMMSKMWIFWVVRLVTAYFFVLIFSKGYENKGLMEGVRYGLYAGVMLSVGYAYGSYASFPMPYSMALQWFLYGVATYVIAGVALAWVFSSKMAASTPAA